MGIQGCCRRQQSLVNKIVNNSTTLNVAGPGLAGLTPNATNDAATSCLEIENPLWLVWQRQ